MVRLKGIVFPEVFFIELLFQFLMVRLKGWFQSNKEWLPQISIPYGAIKSYIFAFFPFYDDISIPYGAIKRAKQHWIYQT